MAARGWRRRTLSRSWSVAIRHQRLCGPRGQRSHPLAPVDRRDRHRRLALRLRRRTGHLDRRVGPRNSVHVNSTGGRSLGAGCGFVSGRADRIEPPPVTARGCFRRRPAGAPDTALTRITAGVAMRRVRTRGGARRVGRAGGHAIRGHARRRDPSRQGAVVARASGVADACCSRRRTRAAPARGGCARRSGSDQDTRAARCRPALRVRFCPWRRDRRPDHPDPFRAEHLIEGSRELAVAVANQEARPLLLVGDRHDQVARLLRDPGAVGVSGHAGQMHATTLELDEKEHVQASQPERVDGEEDGMWRAAVSIGRMIAALSSSSTGRGCHGHRWWFRSSPPPDHVRVPGYRQRGGRSRSRRSRRSGALAGTATTARGPGRHLRGRGVDGLALRRRGARARRRPGSSGRAGRYGRAAWPEPVRRTRDQDRHFDPGEIRRAFRAVEVGERITRREGSMAGTKRPTPRSKGRRGLLTVVMVLVAVATMATARAATVISETTWGGVNSEVTNGAAVASDGSTYLAGFTNSFDPLGQDTAFVVKFTPEGSVNWQRTFDGPAQFSIDRVNGVAVATDGSVYAAGQTDSFGGFGHLFVLRFAPDGTLVWQRIRDVATDAAVGTGQAITVAPDGSIYAAGVTPRAVVGEFDMLLLKLDAQGTLVWQRTYSAADVADARGGVAVGSDGSVYVAGGIQAVTRRTAVNDTFVAKFGADGSLIWDRGFGGDQGDFPGGVVGRADGTVLIGGESASFGAGSDDAFLLQLDANGRGVACNSWGGPGIDHGDDVELAPNGTILLAGTTASSPPLTFATCGRQTRRLRGAVGAPEVPLADATGTLADPGGTVATPNGTSPGAGGSDAALVRIAP